MIPVSLLSAYLYCPRKVYLQKVLKLTEPTRESALKGTIKHMVFSAFAERERSVVSSIYPEHSFKDVRKHFEDAFGQELKNAIIQKKKPILRLNLEPDQVYRRLWPHFERDITARAMYVWDFIQKTHKYGTELWENLTPKIKSEYALESESLGLKGVVDQVLVYENALVPLEIKTGQPPKEGIWPGHRIQLAAYMLVIEDIFSMAVKKGEVYYLSNDVRELHMNPFLKNDVLKTKETVENLLNSTTLPPILKKEGKCEKCGLKEKCHDEKFIRQLQQKTLNTT